MEKKKFCKFCGEQVDSDAIICTKCGKQLETSENKDEINSENEKQSNTEPKLKFYEKDWFMWLALMIFPPIGILFIWLFQRKMKKSTKIALTAVFSIIFLFVITPSNNSSKNTSTNNATTKTDSTTNSSSNDTISNSTDINTNSNNDEKAEVTMANFSTMNKSDAEKWCKDNNIKCSITDNYSDTVEKGSFISQSVSPNTKVREESRVTIVYSLGKKPSAEYTNALKTAESYSKTMHMSKKRIYEQLTSTYGEKFSADATQYAIDNLKADYKENALETAKTYHESMNMSKKRIYDQLVSSHGEKFTKEEAQYAIDHLAD